MLLRLRWAGLNEAQLRQVTLAGRTLVAHDVVVRIEPWNGTRCDGVVVDDNDAYGTKVIALAASRSTDAIRINRLLTGSGPGAGLSSIRKLSDHMLAMAKHKRASRIRMETGNPLQPRQASVEWQAGETSALVRLSSDPTLADADLKLERRGTRLWLLRGASRVVSRSLSDRLHACDHLWDTDWHVSAIEADMDVPPGEVTDSLDVFLLRGAMRRQGVVQPFPDRELSFVHWPDFGSAPDLVSALETVALVRAGIRSPNAIARKTGLGADELSRQLWALSASGSLSADASVEMTDPANAMTTTSGEKAGVLQRLARHFGLFSRYPLH